MVSLIRVSRFIKREENNVKHERESKATTSPIEVRNEWFTRLAKDQAAETIFRFFLSYWRDAWQRLIANKLAMLGLIFLILLISFAILGPILSPFEVNRQELPNQYQPPSLQHWFGTDAADRKSTRLNSSHVASSYAVFCFKKKSK